MGYNEDPAPPGCDDSDVDEPDAKSPSSNGSHADREDDSVSSYRPCLIPGDVSRGSESTHGGAVSPVRTLEMRQIFTEEMRRALIESGAPSDSLPPAESETA